MKGEVHASQIDSLERSGFVLAEPDLFLAPVHTKKK
jgi:hypothetical protein